MTFKTDYPHGRRGTASMSKEKRRGIASLGGLASAMKGVSHKWNKIEAQAAGRKSKRGKTHSLPVCRQA